MNRLWRHIGNVLNLSIACLLLWACYDSLSPAGPDPMAIIFFVVGAVLVIFGQVHFLRGRDRKSFGISLLFAFWILLPLAWQMSEYVSWSPSGLSLNATALGQTICVTGYLYVRARAYWKMRRVSTANPALA